MQKKLKMPALILTLVMMLSITAGAISIQPRWNATTKCNLGLGFDGTTAHCTVSMSAVSGSKIRGSMTIYRLVDGKEYALKGWSLSGTTRVNKTGTEKVTEGYTYKVVVKATVEGPDGTSDEINESTTGTL